MSKAFWRIREGEAIESICRGCLQLHLIAKGVNVFCQDLPSNFRPADQGIFYERRKRGFV